MTTAPRETVEHVLTLHVSGSVCSCGRAFRQAKAAKRHLRVDVPREREDEARRALLGPEWRFADEVAWELDLSLKSARRWLKAQVDRGRMELDARPGQPRRWRALP